MWETHTIWNAAFLLLLAAALALYPAIIRRAWRANAWLTIVLLWAALSLALGYSQFRSICSRGLTCDVGGPDAARYYLAHVFLPVTRWHALALAVVTAVLKWREWLRPGAAGWREVAVGAGATVICWAGAFAFMARLRW